MNIGFDNEKEYSLQPFTRNRRFDVLFNRGRSSDYSSGQSKTETRAFVLRSAKLNGVVEKAKGGAPIKRWLHFGSKMTQHHSAHQTRSVSAMLGARASGGCLSRMPGRILSIPRPRRCHDSSC